MLTSACVLTLVSVVVSPVLKTFETNSLEAFSVGWIDCKSAVTTGISLIMTDESALLKMICVLFGVWLEFHFQDNEPQGLSRAHDISLQPKKYAR